MDSEDDGFPKQGGEALEIGDDFDSEDDGGDDAEVKQDAMRQPMKSNLGASGKDKAAEGIADVKGQKVDNQPFDLAVDVDDSEEIDSDEEEDQVNVDVNVNAQKAQIAGQQRTQAQTNQQQDLDTKAGDDDDVSEDEKEVPGAYNPAQYANLPVSNEVKELFEYIQRYKPQKIDLDTKIKPFIPDYIPAVGEVDAFLKMPKPDGQKEDLGITVLDEPALNNEDKTVLELKYVQSKNVTRSVVINVDSIEYADKKSKEISRWVSSVQDLHKTRPPPTVNYTKNMPDIDTLMQEWNPEME